MNQPSLFSRYYKDVMSGAPIDYANTNEKIETRQEKDNQSENQTQNKNYFQKDLTQIYGQSAPKKEKKLKIFGLTDKKNKKEEDASPFVLQQDRADPPANNDSISEQQILLQSQKYITTIQMQKSAISMRGQQLAGYSNTQLQKLLQISSQLSQQQLNSSNIDKLQNNQSQRLRAEVEDGMRVLQAESLKHIQDKVEDKEINSFDYLEVAQPNFRKTESAYISSQKSKIQEMSKGSQLQVELQDYDAKSDVVACEIMPSNHKPNNSHMKSNNSHMKSNNSYMKSSDSKKSQIQNNKQSKEDAQEDNYDRIKKLIQTYKKEDKSQKQKGRDANVQTSILSDSKSDIQSNTSIRDKHKLKQHKNIEGTTSGTRFIQINKSQAKPNMTEQKPFVPLPKKQKTEDKKSNQNIANYLSTYGSYGKQIQKLINRYEKVSELKEKDQEIKKAWNSINHKKYQSLGHTKDYYFPEQINIKLVQSKRQSFKIKQQKQERTSSKSKSQANNDLQEQLSQKVAKMQKIINKFKQISQTLSVDNDNEIDQKSNIKIDPANNFKRQSNRRSLLNEMIFASDEYNSTGKLSHIKSDQKLDMNSMTQIVNKKKQQKQNESNGFMDSINYTGSYNDLMNESLQKMSCKTPFNNVNPKYSAKTQKKQSTVQVSPIYHIHSGSVQQNHCQCNSSKLAEEINILHQKIAQLQKDRNVQLRNIRSLDKFQKEKPKLRSKIEIDRKSIEEDESSINLSIPQQKIAEFEQVSERATKRINPTSNSKLRYEQRVTSKDQVTSKLKRTSLDRERSKQKGQKHIHKGHSNLKQKPKPNTHYNEDYQQYKINFPIFESYPSRQCSQIQLVQIGEQMFKNLLNFTITRQKQKPVKPESKLKFKIKKYIDCIHYYMTNSYNYHLIYYYKGKVYFGEWMKQAGDQDGFKQGYGYYYHPKKYTYQGGFCFDKKHGKGTINYVNGDVYHGEWINGKKQGVGVLVNSAGDVFRGVFRNGKKNGLGQQHLNNGDYYKGQFKEGKLEGDGVYQWADGSVYKGQFKNGYLHGRGLWRSKQNDSYEGQYKNNKKHGQGTYKWSNGMVFNGYFAQDQKITKKSIPTSPVTMVKSIRKSALPPSSKQKYIDKRKISQDRGRPPKR